VLADERPPTELAPFEINPFGRGQGVAAPPD